MGKLVRALVACLALGASWPAYAGKVSKQELGVAILRAAKAYDVDPRVLHAIAHLESSGGKQAGLRANKNGTFDVGPFQINSVHWGSTCKAYDVRTAEGGAMCAAKLLQSHRRHRGADSAWVGRYHSRTPSLKARYAGKVNAYIYVNFRGNHE